MKNGKAKKRNAGRKAKAYSDGLVKFCRDFDRSEDTLIAADAFANWDGAWWLENLPADAPTELRQRLVAVNEAVAKVQPAFDALMKEVGKIAR